MLQIISLLVGLIGSSSKSSIDNARERIKQEGITSRAYMEGAKQQIITQWQTVAQGYASGDIVSAELAKKYLTEKAKERSRRDEEDKKKQWMIMAALAAAALLLIFLISRSKN